MYHFILPYIEEWNNYRYHTIIWFHAIFLAARASTILSFYLGYILEFSVPMGESFQDQSWIQDFEADFPQKVSLKMLK